MREPRIALIPPYSESDGDAAIELARHAGLILDDWQQYLLRESLGIRADGKWSAFEVAFLVARQNGKGAYLEARSLAGLFLFNEQLIVHTAHQTKTAQEAFRRIVGAIEGTPDLKKRVEAIRHANGEQAIVLKNGNRLRILARSKSSGRGFSADCLILDEAQELGANAMGALLPTLSARPNAQIVYCGTVPGPENDSAVFTRVRDRGRSGEAKDLAWFEWSPGEDVGELDDRARWAQANPAMGIRVTEESIAKERASLDDETFARERLSVWPSGANAGLFGSKWAELVDTKSGIVSDLAFGVAVTLDGIWSCISAAGRNADGDLHLEVIDHKRGTGWVAKRLKQLLATNPGATVVIDSRGPASRLSHLIEAEGVTPQLTTTSDLCDACADLADLVGEDGVRHLDDPDLNAAVAGAMKRAVGDRWAIGRKTSLLDVTPLEAAVLAGWAVTRQPADYDVLDSVF